MTDGLSHLEYMPSRINQTVPTKPVQPINPVPDVHQQYINYFNQHAQNPTQFTATPIGTQILNSAGTGILGSIPGLSTTIDNANKFSKWVSSPSFGTNALGLIIGIVIAFIAISALLAEQNPILKTARKLSK